MNRLFADLTAVWVFDTTLSQWVNCGWFFNFYLVNVLSTGKCFLHQSLTQQNVQIVLPPDKSRIQYTDLKPTINKFLHTKWQQQWSNNIHNKLFQIQPTLGEWRPALRKSRREQVFISWLRICHTRLTHSFILKQEQQPQCSTCQTTYTIKHILIECRTFPVIRKRFFKVNNLTDLFENVKIDDILSFLRETELYQKIWQLKTG